MRRALLVGFSMLAACGSGDSASELPRASSTSSAIINGDLDREHSAVVAVISDAPNNNLSVCTGTIVQTDPAKGIGWVATAAHCITEGKPIVVWEGADVSAPSRVRHDIVAYAADPRFDYDNPREGYDFAVIRIDKVTSATPFIPLVGSPDAIVAGTAIDNPGFGRTTKPPTPQTQLNGERRIVSVSIDAATEILLRYNAATKGACQGDSGGPWIIGEGDARRVVGIDSFGNTTCDGFAFAARVQSGLDFLNAQLGQAVPEACELCRNVARSSGGKCADATEAGLAACYCTSACVEECKATAECIDGTPPTPSTSEAETPAPASDAGPDIVVVTKEGDGCSIGRGRSSSSPPSWLAGVALAFAFVRLRPYRSSRR